VTTVFIAAWEKWFRLRAHYRDDVGPPKEIELEPDSVLCAKPCVGGDEADASSRFEQI